MINIKNQIPSIYYDASRDFQILGHLYEVALNYTKTNADMLYLLPNNITTDTRATELLALTLGFKIRRNYDKKQLAALVGIFPLLLRIKGTLRAVDLAGNALVKASGVPGVFVSSLADHVLTIKIPQELSDITLFLDLLPYIMPFGIRVSIVRTTTIKQKLTTQVGTLASMRKALPGNHYDGLTPHPLGLAKPEEIDKKLQISYPNAGVVTTDTHEAIAGLMASSPIIAFDPADRVTNIITENEEEN